MLLLLKSEKFEIFFELESENNTILLKKFSQIPLGHKVLLRIKRRLIPELGKSKINKTGMKIRIVFLKTNVSIYKF